MVRNWKALVAASAILAVAGTAQAGGKEGYTFQGNITQKDPRDTKPGRNFPFKAHTVNLRGGQVYSIYLSGNFSAYVRIEDEKGKEFGEGMGADGQDQAQITFKCVREGAYKIICSSLNGQVGNYTLTVGSAFAANAAHAVLFNKPAPELKTDFALIGKQVKLADLKGKVVLLEFFDVRFNTCVAVVPRLNTWHKAHKEAGLEVIGLSHFNSQMGHKLRFDAEAGKIKPSETATVETDKAMLKAFAEHHEVIYPILLMQKENAVESFNDYIVNGLPQVVLIDRKGTVRFTFVGDSIRSAGIVDAAIRELLEEK